LAEACSVENRSNPRATVGIGSGRIHHSITAGPQLVARNLPSLIHALFFVLKRCPPHQPTQHNTGTDLPPSKGVAGVHQHPPHHQPQHLQHLPQHGQDSSPFAVAVSRRIGEVLDRISDLPPPSETTPPGGGGGTAAAAAATAAATAAVVGMCDRPTAAELTTVQCPTPGVLFDAGFRAPFELLLRSSFGCVCSTLTFTLTLT
jgi:hypothetical protein